MNLMMINSSMIKEAAYEPDGFLYLTFNNGAIYKYIDVPQAVFDGFMASSSKGKYFIANIKSVYETERLDSESIVLFKIDGKEICLTRLDGKEIVQIKDWESANVINFSVDEMFKLTNKFAKCCDEYAKKGPNKK